MYMTTHCADDNDEQPASFQIRALLILHRRQIQKRLSHSRLKLTCRSLVELHYFATAKAKLVRGWVDRVCVRWYGNLQLNNHHYHHGLIKVQPSAFAFEILDHHHD